MPFVGKLIMRQVLIAILFTAVIWSCANVFRYERNAIIAHGEVLNASKEPLYYSIWIDLTKSINEGTMDIRLKLTAESPPVSLRELNPKLVAQYLSPFTPPPQWPNRLKQKAKEEEIFAGGGIQIKFKNGQLLFVDICSHCANGRENPVVGTPNGQHFYNLPLTEQQIIEIFGSPKRIYKVNEVRY